MNKGKNVAYWVTTGLLSFCMLGGIGQLIQYKPQIDGFSPLGYPVYFLSIIGFWKTMSIIALIIPKFPLLKEWAYAGIFFAMTGASISQMASNGGIFHILVPLAITCLAIASWNLRPPSRKVILGSR
jgi:hypothetical protein